jgi:hypothetical protein
LDLFDVIRYPVENMLRNYSIIVDDDNELDFLRYVKEEKINGSAYPMPFGLMYKLDLHEEDVSLLKLKFNFRSFGKTVTQPK